MTESEKIARALVEKFKLIIWQRTGWEREQLISQSKQCALICVDEMIKQNGEIYLTINSVVNPDMISHYRKVNGFLFEVKADIGRM